MATAFLVALYQVSPPPGGISALAWVIIVVLAGALVTSVAALWYRGIKIQDTMYEDLKACNERRNKSEEDTLGTLKVLRLQMENSKGGKKR